MVDRLELAKQYVQEMLEKRDDIVGAFVVGSVARGDADESSDIDLILVVEEVEEMGRGGIDTWRDGVYIEAGLAPAGKYGNADAVLRDIFAAGHLTDALILHDPDGHLARVQQEVQARYMEPEWLGRRVHHQLGMLKYCLAGLRDGVDEQDPLWVCSYVPVPMWVVAVPLLLHGVAPSSTRGLLQVEAVAPGLRDRIFAWEGSTQMSLEEVVALMPLASRCLALQQAIDSEEWGQMYGHFESKAKWYLARGSHRMALHLMGFLPGGMTEAAVKSGDPENISAARELVAQWLHAVGWEGQEVLEEKVRTARQLVAEMEAMAADLPSPGG
jgi:hypothetical protein